MIALLAAVSAETDLIRQSLEDVQHSAVDGMTLITGRLSGHEVCLAHGGTGKAAAAAAAVTLLINCRPNVLWLFGCGGAYPGSGMAVGDLALASAEIFGDEGVATARGFHDLAAMKLAMRENPAQGFNTWPVDQRLLGWAQPLLERHVEKATKLLSVGPFVTVSTCTGTAARATELKNRTGGICENMEGAAVALACQQLSIPLLEVRGISNLVEDRDTSRWNLAAGMAAAQQALLALVRAWPGSRP